MISMLSWYQLAVEAWLRHAALQDPDVIRGIVEGHYSLREAYVAHQEDRIDALKLRRSDPPLAEVVGRYEAGLSDRRVLEGLRQLDTGLVPGDAVGVAQVDVHGGIDVGLQSPGHIVEAAVEADFAGAQLAHARDVLDALDNLVPRGVELVGGGISRGGYGVVPEDEGIEGDDLTVGMEDVDGELAGDEARDWGDGREDLLLS